MNASEHNEVHEISSRLEKLIGRAWWVMGGVATAIVLLIGYGLDMENRVTTLEQSNKSREQSIDRLIRLTDRLALLPAKVDAQARTLDRIDSNMTELTRYLRDNGANQ